MGPHVPSRIRGVGGTTLSHSTQVGPLGIGSLDVAFSQFARHSTQEQHKNARHREHRNVHLHQWEAYLLAMLSHAGSNRNLHQMSITDLGPKDIVSSNPGAP